MASKVSKPWTQYSRPLPHASPVSHHKLANLSRSTAPCGFYGHSGRTKWSHIGQGIFQLILPRRQHHLQLRPSRQAQLVRARYLRDWA